MFSNSLGHNPSFHIVDVGVTTRKCSECTTSWTKHERAARWYVRCTLKVESRMGAVAWGRWPTRMPTLLPFGEGCTSGEAIDTRTRLIRRGSGHGTSERWFG